MFSKTPKTFYAVDVVFRFFIDHAFGVIDGVMFPQSFERVIALECIGEVHRPFPCFLSDDLH